MLEETFILFDSFLVKKNDIIYAIQRDNNSIELHIKKGNDTQQLTMKYEDFYDAKHALKMLATETDALTLTHHKIAIVQQMGWLTGQVRETIKEMEKVKKELNSLRMELRRNRLATKKDKQK